MLQNSVTHWRKKASNPFVIEEAPVDSVCDAVKEAILVSTKPSATEHIPVPKDYKFDACFLPKKFEDCADKIRKFKVRKDDIWVVSFPKSGSTWIQNIVTQLKHGVDVTKSPILLPEAAFLEWDMIYDGDDEVKQKLDTVFGNSLEQLEQAPSPRIIKSHLPVNLLPVDLWIVQPKIIYIARNPKDVAVSMFHLLHNDFGRFNGKITEYFDLFLRDQCWYAPIHSHINHFWLLKHLDYCLFLNYDELTADRFNGIQIICGFLGVDVPENQLKQLADYEYFKKETSGGFVAEMPTEYQKKFDEWIAVSLKDSAFKFSL